MTAWARETAAAADLDDRFDHVTLLRAGQRSAVFEARDRTSGRRVVIKLPGDGTTRWAVDAYLREAAILGAIGNHPHVITLFEHLTLPDGRPALVLERCSGSLGDLTGTYHPSVRSVVSMGIKLCGALETVHNAGMLHTDVRPANVLVTEWGEPALAGFDEAISIEAAQLPLHALHATTSHTAPELLEGAPPSERTDVYGLAVTLYELLAGHPAFASYAGESQSGTSLRILRGVRAPLRADIPIGVADLLDWALSVDPADRPPSPAWFAEELSHIERRQDWPRTIRVTGGAVRIH